MNRRGPALEAALAAVLERSIDRVGDGCLLGPAFHVVADYGDGGGRLGAGVAIRADRLPIVADAPVSSSDVEIVEQRDVDDAENRPRILESGSRSVFEHRHRRRERRQSRLEVVRPVQRIHEPGVLARPLVAARFLGDDGVVGKFGTDHLEKPSFRLRICAGFHVVDTRVDVRVLRAVGVAQVRAAGRAGFDRGSLEFVEDRHGTRVRPILTWSLFFPDRFSVGPIAFRSVLVAVNPRSRMDDQQAAVADFVETYGLETPPEFRLLDLVSEVGELAKDANTSTEYGDVPRELELATDEIGDVLFATLALADSLEVDAGDALEEALEKYERRLSDEGTPGSGE